MSTACLGVSNAYLRESALSRRVMRMTYWEVKSWESEAGAGTAWRVPNARCVTCWALTEPFAEL